MPATNGQKVDNPEAPIHTGATIQVNKVSKFYGDVVAVSDVSFSLEPGVTALLGPNGAGKSTMLEMLTGLLRPSSGQIEILGRSVRGDRELYRLSWACSRTGTHVSVSDGTRISLSELGAPGCGGSGRRRATCARNRRSGRRRRSQARRLLERACANGRKSGQPSSTTLRCC